MSQKRRAVADRTRSSKQGRPVQRKVRGGRVWKSGSRDGSTIAAPCPASLTAGSTVCRTRGAMEGPTPSRPQIAEPALGMTGSSWRTTGSSWRTTGSSWRTTGSSWRTTGSSGRTTGSSQRMTVWPQMMENMRITIVRAR